MTTKKKISATVKESNGGSPLHTAAKIDAAGGLPSASDVQLKNFESAIRLFSAGKLSDARECFVEVMKGPAPPIADKARSYIQVCDRRTTAANPQISSAEDHFNHGVERLNARDVATARTHFRQALQLQPDADHVLYTMALCCGLAGDCDGACENLKRAIDLEPRNRILARQDPEFLALASQLPELRALLAAESPGNSL